MSFKMRGFITSDIYKMSKILKKMNIKIEGINKNSSIEDVGIQFIQRILENLHQAEDEVNEFVADLVGITAKEFGELPITDTIKIFSQLKEQEDLLPFLELVRKSM